MLDCVIPAAGASQRMGSWKPALAWRGGWVIDAVVATALAAGVRIILVVHDDALGRRFSERGAITIVRNDRAELGMFSSIQRGVRELRSQRFYVLPADMPLVPVEVFAELCNASATHAVRPVYRGRPGHPVLLSRTIAERILLLPATADMRHALDGIEFHTIETADDGVCFDLDTPDDYRALLYNRPDSD